MSQQDSFVGGFLLGAALGGVVGGVLGAVLATRQLANPAEENSLLPADLPTGKAGKLKRRSLKAVNGQDIETARRNLEDKIARLNDAIDDVRQQLGSVNGSVHEEEKEAPFIQES